MNLADVMDEVATALEATGLRVTAYPADRVTPPAATIGYPTTLDYDATMTRGADVMVLPVMVIIARVDVRTARDALAQYADGSGAESVKQVLEAHTYTACDSVRVQSAEFGQVTIAGVDYLSGIWNVHVIGSGA